MFVSEVIWKTRAWPWPCAFEAHTLDFRGI